MALDLVKPVFECASPPWPLQYIRVSAAITAFATITYRGLFLLSSSEEDVSDLFGLNN